MKTKPNQTLKVKKSTSTRKDLGEIVNPMIGAIVANAEGLISNREAKRYYEEYFDQLEEYIDKIVGVQDRVEDTVEDKMKPTTRKCLCPSKLMVNYSCPIHRNYDPKGWEPTKASPSTRKWEKQFLKIWNAKSRFTGGRINYYEYGLQEDVIAFISSAVEQAIEEERERIKDEFQKREIWLRGKSRDTVTEKFYWQCRGYDDCLTAVLEVLKPTKAKR